MPKMIAREYRFSWCDALRSVIDYDEWVQEVTKVTAFDASVTSMFFWYNMEFKR